MKITDIFLWVSEKEMNLEKLKQSFVAFKTGMDSNGVRFSSEIPRNATENIVQCQDELIKEEKKVVFALMEGQVVALIGYIE